jgi:hypothetical protein
VAVEDSARAGESATALFDRVYAFTEKKLLEKFAETEAALEAAKS